MLDAVATDEGRELFTREAGPVVRDNDFRKSVGCEN